MPRVARIRELIDCLCGCGTKIRSLDSKGRQVRFVRGHARIGKGIANNLNPLLWEVNSDGCWIWKRAKNHQGYGHMKFGKTTLMAHRAVYEKYVGPIPNGLTLDHICRNRACVNPSHLEPVTHTENCRRGSKTKLTSWQVSEIRNLKGPLKPIAEQFNVTAQQVWHIRHGHQWKQEST